MLTFSLISVHSSIVCRTYSRIVCIAATDSSSSSLCLWSRNDEICCELTKLAPFFAFQPEAVLLLLGEKVFQFLYHFINNGFGLQVIIMALFTRGRNTEEDECLSPQCKGIVTYCDFSCLTGVSMVVHPSSVISSSWKVTSPSARTFAVGFFFIMSRSGISILDFLRVFTSWKSFLRNWCCFCMDSVACVARFEGRK